ncbi:hypothetical protein [Delftia sp. CH05]|uniref:hypothetical protein n=1 Tax=Delftia sp. CH05 TaxID=2692194 RepID=UPI00135EF54B|nr:hypothetical protein [Delftia sp. CH05]MXN29165.1 hypothetical protein [Delftia sp. CH05]
MRIIDKQTGEYPVDMTILQERHPRTLMPQYLPRYAEVRDTPLPEYDPETQKTIEVDPAVEDGLYARQWLVTPLSEQELAAIAAARARAEQEARDAARVSVTKRQALLALFDLKGIKEDAILAAIDAIPDEHTRYRMLVDWRAESIESDSPTVLLLASALNIMADLPALFEYAEAM